MNDIQQHLLRKLAEAAEEHRRAEEDLRDEITIARDLGFTEREIADVIEAAR